ncbi:MAG: 8-amino-7-oxononanoate synthase [Cocleimonas sp.]
MKNDSASLKAFLYERKKQYLYRSVKISESAQHPLMKIDGKACLNFCSNDYLGLANHPEIVDAFKKAADKYGVSSGAAHLINGHSIEHHKLEEALAEFTGRDKAILFSNGYMANLGVLSALLERGDYLYQDRLNHASLIDAGLLSKSKMKRYRHNDIADLNRLYAKQESTSRNSMIVTDGVFSMDGDEALVNELATIAKQQQAWLMVDDAHGFGVLGERGAGLLAQQKLNQSEVPILMATLGKACGTSGAFVAGSEDLVEYLTQTARTFIYTTAMPPSIAAATLISLKLIAKENWRREQLANLIQRFKLGAEQLGIELMESDTAIQPIMIGSTEKAVAISQALQEKNILVTAIRPPTVPDYTARLRVTFSTNHTPEQVDTLLEALGKVMD